MKDNSSVLLFSSNNIYFVQKEPIKMKVFETFEFSGQNLSNSPCQFSNDKSIPLQILYHSSVSWNITPLYLYNLLKRSTSKLKFLRLVSARVKINQFPMSILKRKVNSSSSFASFFIVMTHNSFVNFKLILFLLLSYPIKLPILRLSSTLVKICHIPHFIFQTTSQFFFKFCITLHCHER